MIKIRKIKKQEKVYDINVKDNHNFYANNILVHNCVESFSLSKPATKWTEESDLDNRVTTSSDGLYHACNLLSINLSNMVKASEELFEDVCFYATYILDVSVDEGTMPVLEAKTLSSLIRNVGIGAVGLGDMMAYNNLLYDTEEGQKFGEKIVEKISYNCYKASVKLSKEFGAYPLFKAENYDKILGYDPKELNKMSPNGYDWVALQQDIKENGIRNFYLIAFAPNSSCQVGTNEVITNDGIKSVYNILEEQNFNIEEIENQDPHWIYLKTPISVPTLGGDDSVDKIWYNGVQPTIEIEFEDGNNYEFTYNHKLLVNRDGEDIWVRCDELQENDDIVEM